MIDIEGKVEIMKKLASGRLIFMEVNEQKY
jgi:hypothetical protein